MLFMVMKLKQSFRYEINHFFYLIIRLYIIVFHKLFDFEL